MTMTIKLDAKAVRELFPEGSEARLQLSNAVVAEFVKRDLQKHIEKVISNSFIDNQFLEDQRDQISRSIIRRACHDIKTKMESEIRETVKEDIRKMGEDLESRLDFEFKNAKESLTKTYKAHVERLNKCQTYLCNIMEKNMISRENLTDKCIEKAKALIDIAKGISD